MKGKRLFAGIIALFSMLGVVLGQNLSYAITDQAFYVALSEYRKNNTPNTAYGIGDPTQTGGEYIWDLVSYANSSTSSSDNRDLYCVKGGYGAIWGNQPTTKVEYKLGYDLKTEKSAISGLSTRSNIYSNIAGANYNQILWVTDNMYIVGNGEGKSTVADRTALLKAAGIDYDDQYSDFYNISDAQKITDDDIEVVQQMALWYFTNSDNESLEECIGYHKEDLDSTFVNNTDVSSYTNMGNYKRPANEGPLRLAQMNLLYDYLIEKNVTVKNSSKYDSTTNEIGAPVTIELGSDELKVTDGKVGPLKITRNNDLPYTLDFSINETAITSANSFVDGNGNVVDKDTFVGNIYVKIPSSVDTTNIKVSVNVNYKTTNSTLWVPGQSNVEQPIIEVKKQPHTVNFEFETGEPKPFDLALRKFISAISSDSTFGDGDYITDNGKATGTYLRAPQISGAWRTDETTTLVKNHSKTPLKVKNGDYIEYTIRAYNEGELDGYANEITDYILQNQGLTFASNHPTNTAYGWTVSGNKVKTNYLSNAGGTSNLLTAYDGNVSNLSYKDVKIVFQVTEKNSSNNTLVNIAEISKAKDKDGNDMNNTGDDRDSTPNIDKKGYPEHGYNTEDHEDDIDYEPVVLKKFDLALRKFISAISSDETIDSEDFLTGSASREPVIPGENEQQWRTDEPTTLIKNHSKDPLAVKTGDYVLYTIRVYNEGEVDGYASLIKDNIPDGLEFVATDVTYNGIWTVDSQNSKIVTTNWLARDNERNKINNTVNEELARENGLLKALVKNNNGSVPVSTTSGNLNPDYKDVQVLLKVTEPNTSTRTLTNFAQISGATDEHGNEMNETGDDIDSTPDNGYSHNEDDEDFEPVVLKCFDLSLRKFITSIDGEELTASAQSGRTYEREPVVDTTSLVDGTTATYNHTKQPVLVQKGSTVVYTIRVYNEGTTDGYASQVTDFLPAELEFIPAGSGQGQSQINQNNGWSVVDGSEGRRIVTNKLANTKLNARTENTGSSSNPYTLSCQSLQIECKVKDDVTGNTKITNIAEITEYRDANKEVINPDRDSKSNSLTDGDESTGTLPTDENLPAYKDDEIASGIAYIPGQQDDDDFEKLIVEKEKYDLALRKFITSVNGTAVSTREPEIGDWSLDKKSDSDEYTTTAKAHSKTPVEVLTGDIVRYKIRVYNEGNATGTATQVTDFLPTGLQMVPAGEGEGQSKVNHDNGWEMFKADGTATTDVTEARIIKTSKLSGETINPVSGATISYKDVEVECKVIATEVDGHNLRNIASITGDNGDDVDSSPDVNPTNDDNYPTTSNPQGKGQEDDDDYEELHIVERKYDLALRKFITSVNGTAVSTREPEIGDWSLDKKSDSDEYTTTAKSHSKTPVAVSTGDVVRYKIRVYNEGTIEGTATQVTDFLPVGLQMIPAGEGEGQSKVNQDNGWEMFKSDGTPTTDVLDARIIKTSKLADETISPVTGNTISYKDVEVECKVIATKVDGHNLRNIASITGDNGDDVDSSPDVNPTNDDNYPTTSNPQGKGQEDDDDYEELKMKVVDFALRKYISSVDGTETNRIPVPDVTKLIPNGTEETAEYNHTKTPLLVRKGSNIIYTIRVYNEGEADGYIGKITDFLPGNLEFVEDSSINTKYGWQKNENGSYYTEYLSKANSPQGEVDSLIRAFNGRALDYKDVQIECKVKDTAKAGEKLTNIAEISRYENANGDIVNPDRDSTSSNVEIPEDLPGYRDDKIASGDKFIPGQEDDDDFEKVYIPKFDLALRKFITNVNGTEETSRIPQVDASKLASGESTTATYTHPKDPVKVVAGDIVTYTIRVYNEGEIDGYAAEVSDDIPEHLVFLPENEVNTTYGWKMYDQNGVEITDVSKAVKIKTTYLSKENETSERTNLIKAFNPEAETSDTNPDHKEVKVAFKVDKSAEANKVITNYAQIEKNTDPDGKDIDDIDSTPGKWIEGEDDQDIENLIPSIFDLSLIKYVSQVVVTEDGNTKTTETGNVGNHDTDIIPKVEVNKKKLNSTVVKFIYTIKVANEGDIAGYAKEVTDYIPEGLEFHAEDNPNWTVKGEGIIATRALENTLLQPGDSAPVTVVLTWINGAENLGLKRNWAEISEDYNDKNVPDRDSTPNNKVEGEDDIDFADVLLSIKTGKAVTYILLGGTILLILAGGIILIKKYVL